MDLLILDRENNILDRFSNKFFSNLTYTELLNDIGKGSFSMTIQNSNDKYAYLSVNNRVIFMDDDNEVLFGGMIYNIKPSYDSDNVFYFQNMLGIFNDKILYNDATYSGSINSILTTILGNVNAREDTNISLDCGITDTVTGKEYSKGDKIYSILQDLLDNKYQYTIRAKLDGITASFEFIVKDTIGIDRTLADNNFMEYKYELEAGSKRTIDKVKGDIDIRNTGNAIIWVSGEDYEELTDATSISDIGRIERRFNTSGDEAGETAAYLAERKNLINTIEIIPSTKDYQEVDLGDVVKIKTSGNKFMEFDGGINIVGKSYTLGDLIDVSFILSDTSIREISFIDVLNSVKAKTDKL